MTLETFYRPEREEAEIPGYSVGHLFFVQNNMKRKWLIYTRIGTLPILGKFITKTEAVKAATELENYLIKWKKRWSRK